MNAQQRSIQLYQNTQFQHYKINITVKRILKVIKQKKKKIK